MLKIGVLGAGHLGKIHIRLLNEMPEYDLIGIYDPNVEAALTVQKEYNFKVFTSIDELIDNVDVVDIVTPTLSHYDCAVKALKKNKHVFIEKPITNTLDEARELIELVKEAKVKFQVGHVERFNPAFIAARESIKAPMFIECHRLAQFNPRGTDVSVILDLMIHDLDIILSVVKSGVKKISASGVPVVSDTPDMANARIEFDNGCVANLTASRISMKNMRKTRFFQKDAYIAVDFLEKKAEILKLQNVTGEPDPLAVVIETKEKGLKQIIFDNPEVKPINSIKEELRCFAESINNNSDIIVTIEDGYKALMLAHRIYDKVTSLLNCENEK